MPFDGKNLEQWQINALELADFIEQQPENMFDMSDWGQPWCGTPGCIAGWAAALWPECRSISSDLPEPFLVSKRLGLGLVAAGDLFEPDVASDWEQITKAEALATLRRYAATGKVEWDLME